MAVIAHKLLRVKMYHRFLLLSWKINAPASLLFSSEEPRKSRQENFPLVPLGPIREGNFLANIFDFSCGACVAFSCWKQVWTYCCIMSWGPLNSKRKRGGKKPHHYKLALAARRRNPFQANKLACLGIYALSEARIERDYKWAITGNNGIKQ